ncbi:MAG: hypothetical protein JST47_12205 [Bacteroidetes bacterium]|nr:hypothetical protein [Bacteroidota bacterium]MBS1973146.1 hypothetical protein [Bacteroidota bacterium]
MQPKIRLEEVSSKKLLKTFIHLPAKIYAGYAHYVPPLYADEWKFHDPNHNLSLHEAETTRVLAFCNNEPVGRIMGIIHKRHNHLHNEKTARFYQLDCIDDIDAANCLLDFISTWAVNKGMDLLIGPFGFSDKDPEGVQVEGFENLPVVSTPANPPYLPLLIAAAGFSKKLDCVSYRMAVPKDIPEVYRRIYKRQIASSAFRLIHFKSKKQLRPWIVPVLRLVNETYAPLFGFMNMSEKEMKQLAAQYMPVLDPEFLKVVVDEKNSVAGFVVALPDVSRGLQKAKGRLFPFGFLHIINEAKKAKQLDLVLGAVKPEFRLRGITAMLGHAIMESAIRRKFVTLDSHLILETNSRMRAECEHIGGKVYKRYRVFKKRLATKT